MTKRLIIYGLLFAMAISLGVLNLSCSTNANAEDEPKPADVSLDNYYTKDEIDTMLSNMLDNDYGVLRIEVLEMWSPGNGWYISIDDEYIGRPLKAYQTSGFLQMDYYEKAVTVGDHVISGYFDYNNTTPEMIPQTVYVSSQGLTFLPSLLWDSP